MGKIMKELYWILKIALGCVIFSLGFNLFLVPHELNAGGVSGLAQVLAHWMGWGTVGSITAVMNLILFVVAGLSIGKRFLVGSVVGAVAFSLFVDAFAVLLQPVTVEPLMASLYGGTICGIGLGLVFSTGASTGGSDIIVRLLKRKWKNIPIGTISIMFDAVVAVLTGIAFGDIANALYSGVAIVITGKVVDLVVYSFDYSWVAIIISEHPEVIASRIMDKLSRGVTFLDGHGGYQYRDKKVILSVVKKYQLADLKQLVTKIDPEAFVIVQEAHQVLGDGFSRYTKDSL